tara:strand:- start:2966 stop:3169 length:204 start_codon:yes stop_codon:yes gene_type:complete
MSMTENQKEKFLSQCIAVSPCPTGTNHVMNDDYSGCKICKLTIEELQGWDSFTDVQRESLCNEVLKR